MAVPGAAPPPERLADGPRAFGPLRLVARVAAGRRTTTFLGQLPGDPALQAVRLLLPGQDRAAFEAARRRDPESVGLEHDGQLGARRPAVVGESLATVLAIFMADGRALPLSVALTVAMGVAARLEALGSVHGDLVPHHVLLGYDGSVHLIDPAGPDAAALARVPDRAGYRAPEHLDGGPLDPTSDIFLLGTLLFEMSTGTRLFDPAAPDLEERIRLVQVPRPRDVVGDGYPIELQLVLRKLMRPSRAGRFPTPRAAQDALRLVATTRADVGPGALGSWLRTELAERHAAWARAANLPSAPAEPASVRPRAPSRAQTRPASFLGAGAPTIEELRLDSPVLEAVRRRIVEESAQNMRTLDEDLREELAALKLRRTELPAIPPATTEPTSPGTPIPTRAADDTLDELDVPTPQEWLAPVPPGPRRGRRPQGLAASPPPNLVPELPTEVTRRFPPLPTPLSGADPAADAATSLDEIEAAPEGLAELELFDFDPAPLATPAPSPAPALGAGPAPLLGTTPRPAALAPHLQAGEDPPPESLDDLFPEALMAPTTDRGPAPASLELGWSDGLELDPPATPTPGPAPGQDPEINDDTLQDGAAGELLGADALADLQAAVEIVPTPRAPRGESGSHPTVEDDDSEEVLAAMSAAQAALAAGRPAFFGSEGGASGEAEVAGPRPHPRPSLGDAAVGSDWGAQLPGLDLPPDGPGGQAAIPTQVVRDRVLPNLPEPARQDPRASAAQRAPTAPTRPRAPVPLSQPDEPDTLTPTPLLDLQPVPELPVEETSSVHLVIPISDAELAQETDPPARGHRLVLGLALGVLVAAGALAVLTLGRHQTPTAAPTAPAAATRAPAPAPRPAPPPPALVEVAEDPPPLAEVQEEAGSGLLDDAAAEAPAEAPAPAPAESAAQEPAPGPRELGGPRARRPDGEAGGTWTMRVRVLPETARILVDGRQVPNDTPITVSGQEPVRVNVSAAGYAPIVKLVSPGEPEVLILMRKDRPADPEEEL